MPLTPDHEADAARERLLELMPHLRVALEMAAIEMPGGKVELGVIVSGEEGNGRITCRFSGADFLDDLAAALGVKEQPGWAAPADVDMMPAIEHWVRSNPLSRGYVIERTKPYLSCPVCKRGRSEATVTDPRCVMCGGRGHIGGVDITLYEQDSEGVTTERNGVGISLDEAFETALRAPNTATPECTCYELTGGHQPGCAYNRRA